MKKREMKWLIDELRVDLLEVSEWYVGVLSAWKELEAEAGELRKLTALQTKEGDAWKEEIEKLKDYNRKGDETVRRVWRDMRLVKTQLKLNAVGTRLCMEEKKELLAEREGMLGEIAYLNVMVDGLDAENEVLREEENEMKKEKRYSRKSVEKIFSGAHSERMWRMINVARSKKELREALYLVCCRLQELEGKVDNG